VKEKNRNKFLRLIISISLALAFVQLPSYTATASGNVRLVIDGREISASPAPFIENGRTLVPVRLVSEQLGAQVTWNGQDRTVHIVRGGRSVLLRIDSRLIAYNSSGTESYNLTDVSPKIMGDRTFVPLRLVSNALGVGIKWDDASRTVFVDSSVTSAIEPFFDMRISSLSANETIAGAAVLKSEFQSEIPSAAAIKYLLLDPATARGIVIAQGNQLGGEYNYLPSLSDNGKRIVVAAVYDANGQFISGDAVPVQLAVVPSVSLTGIAEGQIINESVSLGAETNFSAAYVKYEITSRNGSKIFATEELDPYGQYKWTPMLEDNGAVNFKVTAYDHSGNAYSSPAVATSASISQSAAVTALAQVERKLELRGVKPGDSVDKPATLWADRNFDVSRTDYILRDPNTGAEQILKSTGYESFRWFPGPELKGHWELMVRVTDTKGTLHESTPINVTVPGTPKLLMSGVGPNQVITGQVKLQVQSNVTLDSISFALVNPSTGARKVIAGGIDALAEYSYTPASGDGGSWKIEATGTYDSGKTIVSEPIPLTVYTGKVYAPVPIIEKDKFLDMASQMGQNSQRNTGMSAALQTAQAILETGWGQSVPVDKYTGQLSYNLFGIKGTGPAGSVTSNTWEEYNGTTYRIDAEFRAYRNASEGWNDHKNFLLSGSRYEQFRTVMHDSTQGAWALKRAGYATDSKYPIKLMDIIKRYNLQKLDETGI